MESGGDGVKQDRESLCRVVSLYAGPLYSFESHAQRAKLPPIAARHRLPRVREYRAECSTAERTVVALTTVGHPRAVALNLPCGAVMPYVLYASKTEQVARGVGRGRGSLLGPA